MTLENTRLSRRKLLKAGAIGVPAAGVLAFSSTLVTATSANAISTDGWWGSETSAGFQRFLNTVVPPSNKIVGGRINLVVDGVISDQPSSMASSCPGIVGGWEWVNEPVYGSPTINAMAIWLNLSWAAPFINSTFINALQQHYGISPDGRLDAPSQTIKALQNEINQWVG